MTRAVIVTGPGFVKVKILPDVVSSKARLAKVMLEAASKMRVPVTVP